MGKLRLSEVGLKIVPYLPYLTYALGGVYTLGPQGLGAGTSSPRTHVPKDKPFLYC